MSTTNDRLINRTGAARLRWPVCALLSVMLLTAVTVVSPREADAAAPAGDLVWSSGPALPFPRTNAAAVLGPDSSVYVLGGDSSAPTTVHRLGAGSADWTVAPNIDTQRRDLGAVRAGNKIYLFAGTGNDEGSDEVLDYDYSLGDSQDLAKMTTIRFDLGYAADTSGMAYALGGIGVSADDEIWSSVERFDPTAGVWTSVAPMPAALRGLSAIGDNGGSIFVFGGSTTLDDSGIQPAGYRYDVATNTWATIAPMPVGTVDSAVVMDEYGVIYLLGGMTRTGPTDAVQVYDPATGVWSTQTPLPAPVYSHAAAYDSSARIVVAGGFDSSGLATSAVHTTQQLNIPATAPIITSSAPTNGSLDQPYSYDVEATGNPAPTFALATAPAGMTINDVSGLISWQPIDGQIGSHPVVVEALNTAGSAEKSFDIAVVGDTIAPNPPTDVTVDGVTETSVTLTWTTSVDAVGVDHYEVSTAVYTGPRFGKRWVYTVVDTVTVPTSTIDGLAPFTFKRFSVQAFDAAGNASARSPHIDATTLAAPTLTFDFAGQTTGTIQSPAKHMLEFRLASRANPTATFSLVSGPATMTVDATTGIVQWTPPVADIGPHTATFRATNSVASTDLDVTIDVLSDVPQLSVIYNPTTGGESFALAGALFTAQINDASQSTSTYELTAGPTGMTIDATTGAIAWTPVGTQGGTHTITVQATNAGGTADLSFDVEALFTGAATGAAVTGTTLLEPTLSWVAPTGEGADLVDSYLVNGSATWGVGRLEQTHRVSYTVPASETTVVMPGLVTGRRYVTYVTPVDATGNLGLRDPGIDVVSIPALPQIRWSVNGFSGGSSTPGPVIALQPVEIVLTDLRPDPSTITLVDGPAGLTFDSATNTARWIPGVADVTSGYSTATVTFQATNSVGSVESVVPIRVFFAGAVSNASSTRVGVDGSASWDPPTDNVTPVAAYSITRKWTWSGRPRSVTFTVPGNSTSISFAVYPTGAVSHKGITITPVDEFGNLGITSPLITYGAGPTLPSVSLTAVDPAAAELGIDSAEFQVSLNSSSGSLAVAIGLAGTAVEGDDYTVAGAGWDATAGVLTIPEGVTAATITVTPVDDTDVEGDETILASVLGGPGYSVGSPASATATIADNDVAPAVSGRVFVDEPGAPGLSGVRVVLRSAGPNGVLDGSGDDEFVRLVTDADGAYAFEGVAVGLHRVSIVDSTLPDPALVLTVGKDPIEVTLNVNDEAAIDFGYTPRLALGSIDGRVFMDEPGAPGIGNVLVIARSAGPDGIFGRGGDDVFHRVRTEVDGLYLFSDLKADHYRVAVNDSTLPTGLTITVGSDPTRLTLAEAEHTTIDFGYQ